MNTMPSTEECCREITPQVWEERTHIWKDKLFLYDEVTQLFHIPLNMGSVVTRMFAKAETAHAVPPVREFLMLCYDPSPWKSEIYMTVTRPVPGATMTSLSGTFISKVYDGPYHKVPEWIKDMDHYLLVRNKKALRYYFHYAYCPKCAKKYGHNYCVAFARIK